MGDFNERSGDFDSWLSGFEQQCVEEIERLPDAEAQHQLERDTSQQKLYILFQNSATCIAQLYKDRQNGRSMWVPFQNAAASVTDLYKECMEVQKRTCESGFQCGYQRRTRDLLAWARKKKRHIRREDLLAYLAGCPLRTTNASGASSSGLTSGPHSPYRRCSPRQRIEFQRVGHVTPAPVLPFMCLSLHHQESGAHSSDDGGDILGSDDVTHDVTPDEERLSTFRRALAGSCRSGSSPRHQGSGGAAATPPALARPRESPSPDLNTFITQEYVRHVTESRKRSNSSPDDVIMDSPTHSGSKRFKLV